MKRKQQSDEEHEALMNTVINIGAVIYGLVCGIIICVVSIKEYRKGYRQPVLPLTYIN